MADPGAPPDPMLVEIGTRIRARRLERGLTQVQLGEASDLAQGFVWRAEVGRQNLEIRTLARIAVSLGTTMAALLDGIDPDPVELARHVRRRRSTS